MKLVYNYTPFLSGAIFSIIPLAMTVIFIKKKKLLTKWEVRLILLCFFLMGLRLFTPLEFANGFCLFTIDFYPDVCEFLRIRVIGRLRVIEMCYLLSFTVSLILFTLKWRNYRKFLRLLKHAEKVKELQVSAHFGKIKSISVLKSEYAKEPFLIGIRKPKIVLPCHPAGDEKYILLHELEHYRNHDLYYKWFFELLSVMYWWNPFIYPLKKHLGNMLELHKDFAVTNELAQREKINYAQTLITATKEREKPNYSLGLTSSQSFLKIRIHSILNEKKQKKSLLFLLLVFFLIVTSFFFTIEPIAPPIKFPPEERFFIFRIEKHFDEKRAKFH